PPETSSPAAAPGTAADAARRSRPAAGTSRCGRSGRRRPRRRSDPARPAPAPAPRKQPEVSGGEGKGVLGTGSAPALSVTHCTVILRSRSDEESVPIQVAPILRFAQDDI